ncbi:MAG: hypothetical protein AAB539_01750, partial [Patescibacteria group bacterium]
MQATPSLLASLTLWSHVAEAAMANGARSWSRGRAAIHFDRHCEPKAKQSRISVFMDMDCFVV